MFALLYNLPTWMMIRIAGIAAYALLAVGVALGIVYGLPFVPKKARSPLYKTHAAATIAGTGIGLLHGMITVIDTSVPYSWSQLLIPFSAHYKPFLSGLGTLSLYAMLFVILTTDLRNKLKRKVWLAVHMLSYPIFAMTSIHGFFMGTDSGLPGIRMMYLAAVLLVLGLTALRFAVKPQPARASSATPAPVQPEVLSPGGTRRLSERFREARPSSADTSRPRT